MASPQPDEMGKHVQSKVEQLTAKQSLGVLATRDADGHPYASLIAFAPNEDHSELYFVTPKATRKHANLIEDPRVALLINNSDNTPADFHQAMAVTVLGRARTVEESQRADVLPMYLQKHPYLHQFAHSPSCALFAIEITGFTLVQQFQNVSELRMEDDLDRDT